MQCITYQRTKELTAGAGVVTLGAISSLNTDVYIHVQNTATKAIYRQSATSDGSGVVNLDITDPESFAYHPNTDYEVWVTLQTGDIADFQSITINAIPYEGLLLRFVRQLGGSNTYVSDAAQTVEIL